MKFMSPEVRQNARDSVENSILKVLDYPGAQLQQDLSEDRKEWNLFLCRDLQELRGPWRLFSAKPSFAGALLPQNDLSVCL